MRVAPIALALLFATPTMADEGTFTVKHLTPEIALKAAKAGLDACRSNGHQVSVAVVDRSGVMQVLLRDRYAGPHTVEIAENKAWTAVSFRAETGVLAKSSEPGSPAGGLRHFPRVVTIGGGLPIDAGGTLLGGIGVSGGPGGDADDACAKAGIDAVREEIEF